MDRLDPRCRQLLRDAAFKYDGRLDAWLNLAAERMIAFDRVAERPPEWLAGWLARR